MVLSAAGRFNYDRYIIVVLIITVIDFININTIIGSNASRKYGGTFGGSMRKSPAAEDKDANSGSKPR